MDLLTVLLDHLQKKTKNEYKDSRFIYQNKPNKAYFQHDMAYGDFKELPRRTASDKYYMIKHLMLLKIQNILDIKEVFLR